MATTTPRVPQGADACDRRLVAGLAGFLIGVSMVASSLGLGTVVGDAIASTINIPGPDDAEAAPHPNPTAREDAVAANCTVGCATVLQPVAPSRSQSDEVATPWFRQPKARNRDPRTRESSALSLTSQPFDARDWLFIAGMSIRHHPRTNPLNNTTS